MKPPSDHHRQREPGRPPAHIVQVHPDRIVDGFGFEPEYVPSDHYRFEASIVRRTDAGFRQLPRDRNSASVSDHARAAVAHKVRLIVSSHAAAGRADRNDGLRRPDSKRTRVAAAHLGKHGKQVLLVQIIAHDKNFAHRNAMVSAAHRAAAQKFGHASDRKVPSRKRPAAHSIILFPLRAQSM